MNVRNTQAVGNNHSRRGLMHQPHGINNRCKALSTMRGTHNTTGGTTRRATPRQIARVRCRFTAFNRFTMSSMLCPPIVLGSSGVPCSLVVLFPRVGSESVREFLGASGCREFLGSGEACEFLEVFIVREFLGGEPCREFLGASGCREFLARSPARKFFGSWNGREFFRV